MGNVVVAKLRDITGISLQSEADRMSAILAERDAETQRAVDDPDTLADVALRAVRRHDALTIIDLEEALDAERREFQALENTVHDVINIFQQQCAPLVHKLHEHTANMAALRDMLVKRRTEP